MCGPVSQAEMLQTLHSDSIDACFFHYHTDFLGEKQRSENAWEQQKLIIAAANSVPLSGNGETFKNKKTNGLFSSIAESVECKIW